MKKHLVLVMVLLILGAFGCSFKYSNSLSRAAYWTEEDIIEYCAELEEIIKVVADDL